MTTLIGYETIEAAVVDYMAAELSWVNEETVVAGDLDGLLDTVLGKGYDAGIYLDYSGSSRDKRSEQYRGKAWVWEIVGMILLRVNPETIESVFRSRITDLASLFIANATMDGQVILAEIIDMGIPEAGTVNDVPFYWIPFTVLVTDRV